MPLKAGASGHAVCCGLRRGFHGSEDPEDPEAGRLQHGSPFAEDAGLRLVAVEEGRATVTLPLPSSGAAVDPVHRGAITVLVESAATAAALGPERTPAADAGTGELYVSFVRPAPEHPLRAEARVVSQAGGRKSCEVEVRDWNGELVAKGFLSCSA